QRDEPESSPQCRDQAHEDQQPIDHGDGTCIGHRARHAAIHGEPPDAEQHVDDIVQDVDRKQPEEMAVSGRYRKVRILRGRRGDEGRYEAGNTDDEKYDPEYEGKVSYRHDASPVGLTMD